MNPAETVVTARNAQGQTFPQVLAKFILNEVLREQNTGRGVLISPEQLAAIVYARWRGEITHAEARHFFREACAEARAASAADPGQKNPQPNPEGTPHTGAPRRHAADLFEDAVAAANSLP